MDYTNLSQYSETDQIDILIKLEEELIYEAAPYVLELFESCSDFNKMCAAASLGKLGIREPDVYGAKLLPFIKDKDKSLQQEVIESLGLLGYEPAVKPLIELLKIEQNWITRCCIVEALGNIGTKEVVQPLIDILLDLYEDDTVRVYSAIGLSYVPSVGIQQLRSFIPKESCKRVIVELLYGCWCRGDQEAKLELEELLKGSDEDLKELINTRLYEQD